MAHVQKSTKAQVGGLTRHYERFKKENGEYIKFNNQEIDITKSHLNYNLATHQNMNQLDFIKKRTAEVNCPNRKEINVMCSWVITKPKELNPDEENLFFQEAYKFLDNRYGKDNVISAYVHFDETTPHMHFAFIPIKFDEKKEQYKVCAKEVVNRQDLRTFHKDLSNYMENIFKRNIGLINYATKDGNKSIVELKKETYISKVKELNKKIKELDKTSYNINQLKEIDNDKKKALGNNIKLSKEQYERLLNQAEKGCFVDEYRTFNEKLIKDNKELKKQTITVKEKMKYASLEIDNKNLEKNLSFYQKSFNFLTKENEEFKKIIRDCLFSFSQMPDEIKRQFEPERLKQIKFEQIYDKNANKEQSINLDIEQ